MFGNNDNQQPSDDAVQAAMPDPIAADAAAPSPVFGTPPANVGSPADLTTPEIPATSTPDPAPVASDPVITDASDSDLHTLKQQALEHLTPLVGHLDQTPEEKFRTTMMMIQASDDQTLIKSAFEAAQKITDDKARAQALLDVINEINYFTQAQQQSDQN